MARRRIWGDAEGGRGILAGGGGGEGGGTGSHPLEVRSCRAAQYRGNITLLPSFIPRNPAERQKHQPSSSSPGRFPPSPRFTRATPRSLVSPVLTPPLPLPESARPPLLSSSCPNFIPRSPPHTRAPGFIQLHLRPARFVSIILFILEREALICLRGDHLVSVALEDGHIVRMAKGWSCTSDVFGMGRRNLAGHCNNRYI